MQSPFTPRCAPQSKKTRKNKIINDPIHGHMEFGSEVVKIIDTLYFQRLRELKQLGCASFVFPGAVHNRFMHSLGVAYLAEKVILRIQQRYKELQVTDRDVLMVTLAGLCHDLGHGPFSHEFERVIHDVLKDKRNKARSEEERRRVPESWNHEQASEMLFGECVREAGLDITPDEVEFVKAMIRGVKTGEPRPLGKHLFYFQIVSNSQTGMDVDKYDYLLRDAMFCGAKIAFDISRLLRPEVRLDENGDYILAYYRKEEWMIHQLFRSRFDLYRQVYGHSVVTAFQLMYAEVLFLARDWLRLYEAINNPKLYLYLTDGVIHRIECLDPSRPPKGFTQESLMQAQDVIRRIKQRELYTSVLQDIHMNTERKMPRRDAEDNIKQELLRAEESLRKYADLFVVVVGDRDFTRAGENPLLNVPFYADRGGRSHAFYLKNDELKNSTQPAHFWERFVRVYVKEKREDLIQTLERAFNTMFGMGSHSLASPIIRDKDESPRYRIGGIGLSSQESEPRAEGASVPRRPLKSKRSLFLHDSDDEPKAKRVHTLDTSDTTGDIYGSGEFAFGVAEADADGWDENSR